MTPDKTLEELAKQFADSINDRRGQRVVGWLPVLDLLQSATAAQQREVERLEKELHALALNFLSLQSRNRWATQHIKDLLMSADSSWMNGDAGNDWPQAVLAAEKFIRPALSHSGKEGV